MRPLARGDIVLVPFPFTNLATTKRRPAVVLCVDSAQQDFTLAFVSSQESSTIGFGEVALPANHHEFKPTGLTVPSKIRAAKLVTLNRSLITRRLGRLGPTMIAELDIALIQALQIDLSPAQEVARLTERLRLGAIRESHGIDALVAELDSPTS